MVGLSTSGNRWSEIARVVNKLKSLDSLSSLLLLFAVVVALLLKLLLLIDLLLLLLLLVLKGSIRNDAATIDMEL